MLDSLVSTNSFIQEETVNWSDNEEENVQEINIKAEVIDSLTKLPVNISSNDQICIKNEKVNVLHLPMPPSSTNSFDFPLPPSSTSSYETPRSPGTDLRKIPIPTETAREKIKPGESFFKDNNYRNIIASEIFSPATKERPSKIVPKRPSVIKSTPTIDYPNRDLNEFNKLLKVGEGSYGTVYKAFDTISNELVAMKRVRMEHEHEG